MRRREKIAVPALLVTSLMLFFISLALPAFETNVTYMLEARMHSPHKTYHGYTALIWGWGAMFFGCFAWLANVGYFFGLLLVIERNPLGVLFSASGFVIALLSLGHPVIERGQNGYDFYVSGFKSGFYVWLSSIAFLCMAALVQEKAREKLEMTADESVN